MAEIDPEMMANTAYHGLKYASHLGHKYIPTIKKVANHVFSSKGRRSAKQYLKNLTTSKGLQKFVTKDLPGAAVNASKFVRSGKFAKGLKSVGEDVNQLIDIGEKIGGANQYSQGLKDIINKGVNTGTSIADNHNKFVEDFNKHINHNLLRTL